MKRMDALVVPPFPETSPARASNDSCFPWVSRTEAPASSALKWYRLMLLGWRHLLEQAVKMHMTFAAAEKRSRSDRLRGPYQDLHISILDRKTSKTSEAQE